MLSGQLASIGWLVAALWLVPGGCDGGAVGFASGPDGASGSDAASVADGAAVADSAPSDLGDMGWPTGGDAPDAGGPVPEPARALEFADAVGDDGLPCERWCAVYLGYESEETLRVRFVEDGAPVPDQLVTFKVVDSLPTSLAYLAAASAYTDDQGVAEVTVGAAQAEPGFLSVRVGAAHAGVEPLTFDLVVTPDGVVPLTVSSTAADDATTVVKHRVDVFAAGDEGCASPSLLPGRGEALASSEVVDVRRPIRFLSLPLELTTTPIAIMVDGLDASYEVRATGCVEATLTAGASSVVSIPLTDLPPKVSGLYEIHSQVQLADVPVAGLAPYVGPLVALLLSPGPVLVQVACELGAEDALLDQLCGLAVGGPDRDDTTGLTPFGAELVAAVEQHVGEMTAAAPWIGVTQGGVALSDLLPAFRLRGTLGLLVGPPAGTGSATGKAVHAVDRVAALWPGEGPCSAETGTGCTETVFPLAEVQGSTPSMYEIPVEVSGSNLVLGEHSLDIRNGLLLRYLAEHLIVPLLLGADPETSSYRGLDLLVRALLGGPSCVTPATDGVAPDAGCCKAFSAQLAPAAAGTEPLMLEAACQALAKKGSKALGGQLEALDEDAPGPWRLVASEPCQLVDLDGDRHVDGLGDQAAPCRWEIHIDVLGTDIVLPATFLGVRVPI